MKLVEILARSAINDGLTNLQSPISFHIAVTSRCHQRMSRSKAFDIFINGSVEIYEIGVEQKVRNPIIIEITSQTRVARNSLEGIAHKPSVFQVPIEQRPDTKLVASTK